MPRSSGTYTAPASSWNPPINGSPATLVDWSLLLADLSSANTQALSRDGQSPALANLPMGSFKLTNLAPGSASTDSCTFGQRFIGTTTNDDAPAGYIGEYISSNVPVGSLAALTSNVSINITSISLTAGDWDVQGNVSFSVSGITQQMQGSCSTTSGAIGTDVQTSLHSGAMTIGYVDKVVTPLLRFSLAATTSIYLTSLGVFSSGTMNTCGFIRARRIR